MIQYDILVNFWLKITLSASNIYILFCSILFCSILFFGILFSLGDLLVIVYPHKLTVRRPASYPSDI